MHMQYGMSLSVILRWENGKAGNASPGVARRPACTCAINCVHAGRAYTLQLLLLCLAGSSSCYMLSWALGRPLVAAVWPEQLTYFRVSGRMSDVLAACMLCVSIACSRAGALRMTGDVFVRVVAPRAGGCNTWIKCKWPCSHPLQ